MINKLSILVKSLEKSVHEIYQSLISILKVFIISRFGIKLPKTSQNTCYVLGNGPSLKESIKNYNLLFRDQDLICVNHFALSKEYHEFKPKHYVLLDPGFFSPQRLENDPNVKETINKLANETDWQMNLFVPRKVSRSDALKKIQTGASKINIVYFNYTIVQGVKWLTFLLFKKNLGMPACQNVLAAGIFLALNMNYKFIYIFGADHSWLQELKINDRNELYLGHLHFYSDNKNPITQKINKSHLSDNPISMADFLKALARAFNSYYILKQYAKHRDTKIFNATEGSYIDAFERQQPNTHHISQ